MPTRKIGAAGDHLARIVGTRPVGGLAELVWNALDANATEVAVERGQRQLAFWISASLTATPVAPQCGDRLIEPRDQLVPGV
jgi:hypothetical protein